MRHLIEFKDCAKHYVNVNSTSACELRSGYHPDKFQQQLFNDGIDIFLCLDIIAKKSFTSWYKGVNRGKSLFRHYVIKI